MATIYLPDELLTDIFEAVPQSDRASVCRASKLFHALCLPLLYRVVDIPPASIESFCSAVLSNAVVPALVRSLTLMTGPGYGGWPTDWRVVIYDLNFLDNRISLQQARPSAAARSL
jgi:hypothetical protein